MTRLLRLARLAYGTALLASPDRIVRAFGGDPADEATTMVARVLGARHVLQGVVTGSHPGPIRRYGGAVVDALHALSMFTLASMDPGRARPALVDGSVAATFCIAGVRAGSPRS
ncbi:MAG: hypothetical protein ACJ77A_09270 [Actinomycetota bacterium]